MELMFLLLPVTGDDDLRFDPDDDGEFFAAAACCCCNVGSTEAGCCPGFELGEARGLPQLPPTPAAAAAALLFDTELCGDPVAMAADAAADDNDGLLLPAPNGLLDEATPNDICVWCED